MKKTIFVLCILVLLVFAGDIVQTDASVPAEDVLAGISSPQATEPLIIDHNTVDITAVPQYWIEEAKSNLHVYYGHTSHGSQLIYGMAGLVDFANGGGLGLDLPTDIFAGLPIQETSSDAGYYPEWVNRTIEYLGTPDPETGRGTTHPETNVVIWSWCGQVSGISEQDLIDHYLEPMTDLENDYWGVTFVYMTGHSDGSGETGNLHLRNQQIRQYAIDNDKVLYDFYDIELYDPDGNYYGDKNANDDCDYDSDGNGTLDANWCLDWQAAHTEGEDWYTVGCAHSRSINCNQKAYAAWWLWTTIAGWNGVTGEYRASDETGDWSEAATWEDNIVPTAIDAITITAGTTVTVNDSTHSHSIAIEPGATLIIPEGITVTVSGSVDNQGTIEQTRVVNNEHAAFIEITDLADFVRYRGVEIDTVNNLGAVTVSLQKLADNESCTSTPLSTAYAQRCFEIQVTNPGAATVRLWALTEEMNGVSDARVYRYVEPEWVILETNPTNGELGVYTYAEAETPGFSYFSIAQADAPTVVELVEFGARGMQPVLFIAVVLTLSLMLFAGMVFAIRKSRYESSVE